MLPIGVIKKIERIIGSDDVLQAEEDRVCYSYDANTTGSLPDLVVFPRATEQVSRIMVLANEHGFPVIPRGAGSGMTGGATPGGGVVMAMTKFDTIVEIDLDNLIAVVEPGVINYDLQQEVESYGLFFPPDPASYRYSTIGGNVAECAGGPRAVKYGVMRDYVLGLEVVLPTGEVIETGVRTMKGVVGYDLTRLFVGSEGTLGIITKVILKLLPLPEARGTLLAIFPHIEGAASSVAQIIRSRIIPSALEFMDNASLRCAETYLGSGLPADAGGLLLIEVDGPQKVIDDQVLAIEEICLGQDAREVRVAGDPQEEERLWEIRRCLSQAAYSLNPLKVNEDVVVPRSKIPALVKGVEDIEFLLELAEDIKGGALCGLGKTAPNPVLSSIRYFKEEYEAHILEGRCPAKVCPNLTAYYILPDRCDRSCEHCVLTCPTEAIKGGAGEIKHIDQEKCVNCGTCMDVCPPEYDAVVKLSPISLLPPEDLTAKAKAVAKAIEEGAG